MALVSVLGFAFFNRSSIFEIRIVLHLQRYHTENISRNALAYPERFQEAQRLGHSERVLEDDHRHAEPFEHACLAGVVGLLDGLRELRRRDRGGLVP